MDLENSRLLRQVTALAVAPYSFSQFLSPHVYKFGFVCHFTCMQLDDEDTIIPSKLQSALETVLERRRELANERGGDAATG